MFKTHGQLCHSTLGSTVIKQKKKKKITCEGGEEGGGEDVDGGREKHPAQPVKP